MTERTPKAAVNPMTDEDDISLRQYWDVFRRYKKTCIMIFSVTVLAGFWHSVSNPRLYESSVELRKKSGFEKRHAFIKGYSSGGFVPDMDQIVGSIQVAQGTQDNITKELARFEATGRKISGEETDWLRRLSTDEISRCFTSMIDSSQDTLMRIDCVVANHPDAAVVLANAVGGAIRSVTEGISLKESRSRREILERLQVEKREEIQALETEISMIRNIDVKKDETLGITGFGKDLLPMLNQYENKYQETRFKVELLRQEIGLLREDLRIGDKKLDSITWADAGGPLQNELSRLNSQRNKLLTRYTSKNPVVIKVDKLIARIKNAIMAKNRERKGDGGGKTTIIVSAMKRPLISVLMRKNLEFRSLSLLLKKVIQQREYIKQRVLKVPDLKAAYLLSEKTELNKILGEMNGEYQREKIMEASNYHEIEILSPAVSSRMLPSNGNTILFFSFIAGLCLSCIAAFILNSWDETIRSSGDLKKRFRYPVLGVVPYWDKNDSAYIDPATPDSSIGEIYSVLRNNVKYSLPNGPSKCFMVCSAVQNEGKSHTSINLAVSFALEGSSVLLVTVDFRTERNYAKWRAPDCKAPLGKGLTDYLQGNLSKEDLVLKSKVENLFLAPSGPRVANPTPLLRSEELKSFVELAQEHFDVVVIDAPATLPVVDAAVFSEVVSGVLFVVESGKTTAGALEQAIARMEHVGSNIIGSVVNKSRDLSMDPFYGTGYSYYPNYYKSSYRAGYRASYKSTYNSRKEADA